MSKIYVLMAQRRCDYPGQYAPEALECINEFGHEDNPDYLEDNRIAYLQSNEYDAVEIVAFSFDGDELDKRLFPERMSIGATISD